MASGSFEFAVDGKIQGKIEWESSSNGSSANSSTVTAKLYVRRTDGHTTSGHEWRTYLEIAWNGTSCSYYSDSISVTSGWVLMLTHTVTVNHNNDGTGSTWIYGSVAGPYGTKAADWESTGGATCYFDTIPRAGDLTGFSTNSNYLDGTLSMSYNAKANFTNKLRISVSGVRAIKYLSYTNSGSHTYTYNFTANELADIYDIIGTGKTYCTIGVVLETWNGNTKIGESSERTKVLYMSESIKPSISAVAISENVSGIAEKFGAFVQSKSRMTVNITAAGATAGTKTSSISSYTTQIKDSNNVVVATFSGASFTTDFISRSGKFTVVTSAKDSRGRVSDAVTRTITVLGYSKPTITAFTAVRRDSDETIVDVLFSANIAPLDDMNPEPEPEPDPNDENPELSPLPIPHSGQNGGYGNDKSFKITLDQTEKQEYTDDYVKTNIAYAITNVSTNSSHQVILTVEDYFTTVTEAIMVSTGFAIQHISEDGRHISFGQRIDPNDDADVQIHESLSIGGIKVIWIEDVV